MARMSPKTHQEAQGKQRTDDRIAAYNLDLINARDLATEKERVARMTRPFILKIEELLSKFKGELRY